MWHAEPLQKVERKEKKKKERQANYLGIQFFFSSVNYLWLSALHSTSASRERVLGSSAEEPSYQHPNCTVAASFCSESCNKGF